MAAGINTYTDITSLLTDIWEGAMIVADDTNLMAALVRNFDGRGMQPRKSSIYGTVTFSDVAETDDLVPQTFGRSLKSTLTPGEKAADYFLSDQRIESDDQDIVADASSELGRGLAKKIEIDILGNFDNLTGGTIGAAGTVLHWGHILAAQTRLKAANAPMPYNCVLHPYQWHNLGETMTINQGAKQNAPDDLLSSIVNNFWVTSVYGIRFFITSNISVDASDDAYGAMFARDAIALDMRRAPRLERDRDISKRGWELVMTSVYAHGTWRPEWGIQLLGDASVPSY